MNEYIAAFKKYAVFSGRATRQDFWMFCLVHLIVTIGLLMVASDTISNIYGAATFLPILGLSIRRLHDTGRSGWWILLSFLPIIGQIVLIVFYTQKSSK